MDTWMVLAQRAEERNYVEKQCGDVRKKNSIKVLISQIKNCV